MGTATEKFDLAKSEKIGVDTKPAVLMFRPTHYVVVPREQMQAFEEVLRTQVGVIPTGVINGFETICMCGGEGHGYDDCDWLN